MIPPAPKSAAPRPKAAIDDAREGYRKWVVILVSTIYWLLIFEGVLRKWLLPEWGKALFFIRDPLVILLYVLALKHRMIPRQSPFLTVGVLFAIVSVPLICVQFFFRSGDFDWGIAAYGWRNYFLYLPLAFFVAKYFRVASVKRLMRWTLFVSIPIAVLVYIQFRSPASAPINQGLGKTADLQYVNGGVGRGLVRTYGTFTSAVGQQAFIVSSVSILLAAWMAPRSKRPIKGVALFAATAATLTCLALSGSRGTVIWSGLVFSAAFAAALMTGRRLTLRIFFVPALLVLTAILVVSFAFPEAFEAFTERWSRAGESETALYGRGGVFSRAFSDLFSFSILLVDTPLQGYQLGSGGNAAVSLHASNSRARLSNEKNGAGEGDWGRQILELGPVFGILFIIFRLLFVAWLAREAIRATRRSSQPLPMLMFAFVGVLLFNGQITGHGTLNGYVWLFAGFLIVVCKALTQPHVPKHIVPRPLAPGAPRHRLTDLHLTPASAGPALK
jgi:hypothetical protein